MRRSANEDPVHACGRDASWTIRNGKVVRTVWFPSVEEALEAAGVPGQGAQGDRSRRFPLNPHLRRCRLARVPAAARPDPARAAPRCAPSNGILLERGVPREDRDHAPGPGRPESTRQGGLAAAM